MALWPIDIECDAPPYNIVSACDKIGIEDPEDVRWCHRIRSRGRCCGRKLPKLEKYVFTLLGGTEVTYILGQCGRCRTIFWEEG